MTKPMWDAKAVKAYETGQGVELVNEPHPHYEPVQEPQQMTGKQPSAPWNTTSPQRTWVGLTDEEIDVIYEQHHNQYGECESVNWGYERAIEAKLKQKNFKE